MNTHKPGLFTKVFQPFTAAAQAALADENQSVQKGIDTDALRTEVQNMLRADPRFKQPSPFDMAVPCGCPTPCPWVRTIIAPETAGMPWAAEVEFDGKVVRVTFAVTPAGVILSNEDPVPASPKIFKTETPTAKFPGHLLIGRIQKVASEIADVQMKEAESQTALAKAAENSKAMLPLIDLELFARGIIPEGVEKTVDGKLFSDSPVAKVRSEVIDMAKHAGVSLKNALAYHSRKRALIRKVDAIANENGFFAHSHGDSVTFKKAGHKPFSVALNYQGGKECFDLANAATKIVALTMMETLRKNDSGTENFSALTDSTLLGMRQEMIQKSGATVVDKSPTSEADSGEKISALDRLRKRFPKVDGGPKAAISKAAITTASMTTGMKNPTQGGPRTLKECMDRNVANGKTPKEAKSICDKLSKSFSDVSDSLAGMPIEECTAQIAEALGLEDAEAADICEHLLEKSQVTSANGLWLTRSSVERICPACAQKMVAKNIKAIRIDLNALRDAFGLNTKSAAREFLEKAGKKDSGRSKYINADGTFVGGFDGCVSHQTEVRGLPKKNAERLCGYIANRVGKSFPGHAGRPGHRGGSAPKGDGVGFDSGERWGNSALRGYGVNSPAMMEARASSGNVPKGDGGGDKDVYAGMGTKPNVSDKEAARIKESLAGQGKIAGGFRMESGTAEWHGEKVAEITNSRLISASGKGEKRSGVLESSDPMRSAKLLGSNATITQGEDGSAKWSFVTMKPDGSVASDISYVFKPKQKSVKKSADELIAKGGVSQIFGLLRKAFYDR